MAWHGVALLVGERVEDIDSALRVWGWLNDELAVKGVGCYSGNAVEEGVDGAGRLW